MPTRDAPRQMKMRVYFPKYVTINNAPLFILYWIVSIVTVGIAVYQFLAGKRYEIQKLPEGEVQLCSQFCPAVVPTGSFSYCSSSSNFGGSYNGVNCVATCEDSGTQGTLNGGRECMQASDMIQYSPTGIFIPTFYREEKVKNPTWLAGSCPYGMSPSYDNKVCKSSGNWFVKGVEQQTIEFSHKYAVAKPTSSIFGEQPDLEGDSLTDTQTVVMNPDGSENSKIAAGSPIRFTVAQLLTLAGLHECCGEEVGQALNMDESYTRPAGGVNNFGGATLPTPRLTGVALTMDLIYTNTGKCSMNLNSPSIALDGTGACLSVRARRQWAQSTSYTYGDLTADATLKEYGQFERTYSGIQINFHIHGEFKFIDGSAFFRGMTTILIWMGIPIWILYFFAIFFLGKLSAIYNRVIHQELSLTGACVGLAGRLISHTSSFADVQDYPEGLSKKRLHERFKMIMQFSEDLDDTEVRKFVDFVYEGVAIASEASQGEVGDENDLIDVQDFCTVCASNESLTFDALVKIFDRDRRLGTCETLFLDEVIDQARSVVANDALAETVKHALINRNAGATKEKGAGAFNAVMLEQRFASVEEEINKIQQEMNKTLLKEKNLMKQVEFAEKNVEKLGGSLSYTAGGTKF
jgi:hypothetical protein